MPKIKNPKDVHYLSFEGGGGKGVTFLGAIQALEILEVLPIKPKGEGENRIKGISGSSAGAITALLLAMGLNSYKLEKLLSRPEDFNKFFDKPQPGFYRGVNDKNEAVIISDASAGDSHQKIVDLIKQRKEKIDYISILENAVNSWNPIAANIPGGIFPIATAKLWGIVVIGLLALLRDLKLKGYFEENKSNPIVASLSKNVEDYIYNLIWDRGVFPGFAVRQYFNSAIEFFLGERLAKIGILSKNLNFEQFYHITGVDLVITGANITQKRPLNFSYKLTPKFPVAEAVGISMNLPFIFKPVWVDTQIPENKKKNIDPNTYKGFWVDGGLLNNLPIHAFDDTYERAPNKIDPDIHPLSPNVLGIRLTDGFKKKDKNMEEEKKESPGIFHNLYTHLAGIMATVLYPAEEGQIRTPSEEEQTINLYTETLSTTEFAPAKEKREGPVLGAYEEVLRYFGIEPNIRL